ncbi:uncharacterized protein K452DRAFT_299450 [Aplosporella prunicola CBS 121167]|uniref:DSC E3 ubiquitin ligase complex subunit A n=1 Tax=Aplosporella prunicola CBS 121167 TaxID=1176127 RepID=A0A6A6B8Z4_9PEZI|nr:uncharacterized protein K452DRAFT_299450 [Aplosporella prunicola CBS 121167]KAF2140732.1 hypothetical protein K452DRAFT_299450 [Aplosporella prunicola CBS 121167]
MASPPPLVLLLVILLFLYLTPDPASPGESHRLERTVDRERAALETLNNSTFGDFYLDGKEDKWLNLTGFRKEHGLHWSLLESVRNKARQQTRYVLGEDTVGLIDGSSTAYPAVYHNVTGFIQGTWKRTANYDGPHLNLSAITPHNTYSSEDWNRNVSALNGDIRIHFKEKEDPKDVWNDSVRAINARITLGEDTPYGNWWEMRLLGVHLVDTGAIVLTTTSEKFDGVFGLPHLALSKHQFDLSKQLLNHTLNTTIEKQKSGVLEDLNPWSSDMEGEELFSVPHCEYVMYLQQHPMQLGSFAKQDPAGSIDAVKALEDELRFPYKPFHGTAPETAMSMVAFSPDCGFTIESQGPPDEPPVEASHLKGPKTESYVIRARHHVLMYAGVITTQLLLLLRQMKEASTPSTRSRINFHTLGLLAMGDGFTLLGFALFGMQVESTTLLLLAVAYVAFLSVIFFGMGFMKEVWTVQATERERAQRQSAVSTNATPSPAPTQPGTGTQTPSQPIAPPTITPAGADSLPLPVTARQAINSGATPIIIPSDQDVDAEVNEAQANANTTANQARNPLNGFGAVYLRFYLLLFGLVFLSLHATTWPSSLRSTYSNIITFIYFSFWTPQIYRNVMRNCRKAMRWEFVVGQSVLRLTPFAYFYACSSNILLIKLDLRFLAVICGWVWLQLCALVSQEHLGPRFFVKESWVPPAYDYHPVLRADEEGATLPSGGKILAGEEVTAASPTATATTAGESRDKGKKKFDCAICMQDLEVPVVAAGAGDAEGSAGAGLGGGLLARRAYMVTPCRHIFHSQCLEGWMRYRLQCPICREVLPPL